MYTKQEVKQRAQRILSMPAGLKYGTINEIADMALKRMGIDNFRRIFRVWI